MSYRFSFSEFTIGFRKEYHAGIRADNRFSTTHSTNAARKTNGANSISPDTRTSTPSGTMPGQLSSTVISTRVPCKVPARPAASPMLHPVQSTAGFPTSLVKAVSYVRLQTTSAPPSLPGVPPYGSISCHSDSRQAPIAIRAGQAGSGALCPKVKLHT